MAHLLAINLISTNLDALRKHPQNAVELLVWLKPSKGEMSAKDKALPGPLLNCVSSKLDVVTDQIVSLSYKFENLILLRVLKTTISN